MFDSTGNVSFQFYGSRLTYFRGAFLRSGEGLLYFVVVVVTVLFPRPPRGTEDRTKGLDL